MDQELIGKTINCDLFNATGLLVIPEGTTLNQIHIKLMEKHNIIVLPHQLIDDNGTVKAECTSQNEKMITKATEEMRSIFSRFHSEEPPAADELMSRLVPTINEASNYTSLYDLMSSLEAKDDYTFRHNIGVAVLSSMIGRWLYLDKDSLDRLTLAAALHDIGKVRIPQELLNKPGKYTNEEYEQMKLHTTYGYEMLSQFGTSLPPEVKWVALQHHERVDGKGYPYGITGEEMDHFSKIVAVADVFHAMSTNRIYRTEIPFYKVLTEMKDMVFGKMDPKISNLFIHRMMETAIGSNVLLSNKEMGKIVFVFKDDPLRPLIKVRDSYVDLRARSELHIVKLVG